MKKSLTLLSLLFIAVLACDRESVVEKELEEEEETVNPNATWQVKNVFNSLEFSRPVEMLSSLDGSNQLYVLEQGGKVYSFKNDEADPNLSLFLDLSNKVRSGGELGLLGMAFHPDYKTNRKLYVHYTRNNNGNETVISMVQMGASGVGFQSEEILLTFRQPFSNHNAGSIHFGKDGFLYITSGDGGSSGDPQNVAQNLNSFLGKILRIDVNKTSGILKYSIPADNPFINTPNTRPEIFAYGMRNPWKMTMDRETGKFWIADVGQNEKEEINILEKGGNFGWKITEGFNCYSPANNCNRMGLIDPIYDYGTSEGRSITGGYVYRGKKLKNIVGQYIYGDYVSGNIWALKYNETTKTASNIRLSRLIGALSSFGEDENGELFMLNYQSGKLQTIVYE